ncbi:MAG TPA: N-acetyltransferase [Rhizomicrobium sp.]|nr:N-acetyltransferase [Rhizomicrobium sp.]
MWDIRPERADDVPAIEALNATSFGPGRFAKSAYRLRDGVHCVENLSFVAVEDGILRGSIRFWPVDVGGTPALLLGPLAVQSDQRGRGIGIALMKHGIEQARKLGHRVIILVGDAPYYARVGFAALPPGNLRFPGPVNPARILGLALQENALDGLCGAVLRPRIDDPVCANSTALA